MKVMITGSKGQLGKELVNQLSCMDVDIIPCDIEELDITTFEDVQAFIAGTSPSVVINCAAYTAVDKCEEELELAYRVNAIGPRNLAIAAEKIGAKLIHISTDYVFDGEGNLDKKGDLRPYNEYDLIDPQSVYGKTKAEGEAYVKQFCSRHFIIRTAWLYGDGANFVKTMLSLSEKYDTLKVVDDQVGSPTSTYELAKAIISLMDTEYYGTYHGTCEGQCSWYDFTKKIFELKGITSTVNPCTSEEYPRPAKRPHYSVLDNFMFRLNNGHVFAGWEEAIEKYLAESN